MTHSMTAFSRVQNHVGPSVLCWELKSVNHRYLDVSFRLPESFRFLETNLRNLLRGRINRGKLECQLKFNDLTADNHTMIINEGLVRSLLASAEKLAASQQIANDVTVSHVLSWPGVVQVSQPDIESLSEQISQLFQDALTQLQTARLTEGNILKEFITARLHKLSDEIILTRELVITISAQLRTKLMTRLQELELSVAEPRFEQEIALMLARLDVSEELDRLQTHIGEVERALNNPEAVGRQLDFLMQELNREANTLGSKSDSAILTQHAVQMKVLIEQMREQIQNIE